MFYPNTAYNYSYYPTAYPAVSQPANAVPVAAGKSNEFNLEGDAPVPQSSKVMVPDIERAATKGCVTRKGLFGEKGFACVDHWGWMHLNIPHWLSNDSVLTIARVDTQGNIYMRDKKDPKDIKLIHVGKVDEAGQTFIAMDMLRDPAGKTRTYKVADDGLFGKFTIQGPFTSAQRNAVAFLVSKDGELKTKDLNEKVGKTVSGHIGEIAKGFVAQIPALVIAMLIGRGIAHK